MRGTRTPGWLGSLVEERAAAAERARHPHRTRTRMAGRRLVTAGMTTLQRTRSRLRKAAVRVLVPPVLSRGVLARSGLLLAVVAVGPLAATWEMSPGPGPLAVAVLVLTVSTVLLARLMLAAFCLPDEQFTPAWVLLLSILVGSYVLTRRMEDGRDEKTVTALWAVLILPFLVLMCVLIVRTARWREGWAAGHVTDAPFWVLALALAACLPAVLPVVLLTPHHPRDLAYDDGLVYRVIGVEEGLPLVAVEALVPPDATATLGEGAVVVVRRAPDGRQGLERWPFSAETAARALDRPAVRLDPLVRIGGAPGDDPLPGTSR